MQVFALLELLPLSNSYTSLTAVCFFRRLFFVICVPFAIPCCFKAIPHKDRLTALYAICLHISRHLAQKLLEIRQYSCVVSVQSDEKSDCASDAQSLCGIALIKCFVFIKLLTAIIEIKYNINIGQHYPLNGAVHWKEFF